MEFSVEVLFITLEYRTEVPFWNMRQQLFSSELKSSFSKRLLSQPMDDPSATGRQQNVIIK